MRHFGRNVAALQDAVTKLCRYVVEINMKAKVEDGCALSKCTGSRGVGSGEEAISPAHFTPLAQYRETIQVATEWQWAFSLNGTKT